MTITEIKTRLSIRSVLEHYGLVPGPTGALQCPFHDDAKASMKVYPETNTAYCFAGSCAVESVDVIDFILHMEKCDKRTAILKAKELCGGPLVEPAAPLATEVVDAAAVYALSAQAIKRHAGAKAYLAGRGLNWEHLNVGYKSRKTPERWGRGCVIFPLRDAKNAVVSLYGRAIKGGGHYYTAGRRGLYPYYPDAGTRTLVLTESVIDAASIKGPELGLDCYAILALYGTNGLTVEHRAVIAGLASLREIVLTLDGDAAGRAATAKLANELATLRPEVALSYVPLAEGEDVNSVTTRLRTEGREVAELFTKIEPIELVHGTAEDEGLTSGRDREPLPRTRQAPASVLDTINPHDLSYTTATADYRIKGGLRTADRDLDSLKVTLVVRSAAGRRSRQKLDLYEDKQISRAARAVAERLALRADLIELDLDRLTDALESYRDELRERTDEQEAKQVVVSPADRKTCETFLKSPDLLLRINARIERAGIVGEEMNRLLLFVVAASCRMPTTLHALIQGASGSGKTRLLRVIAKLIPEESVELFTRVTESALYNFGERYFTHKLVCFEDLDGLEEKALLAVRELQSGEVLRSCTSVKNEAGEINAAKRIVRGPIASMSCTTRAEVYEDNVSRCFVVAVDESREQSLRVIRYQNRKSAGKIEAAAEAREQAFLRNCLRLLRPLDVINPYADRITLPEEAHKIRRLNELYQSFVRQVTLLNQYQRKRDERGRLITEPEDLRVACEVLFESIVLKVDELDGSLRQFFEGIKAYVDRLGRGYAFNRFELRKATGVSKTQQHRYLSKLVELEYIRQSGFANRGYQYTVAHWDDQAALRGRIKTELNRQIEALEI